MALSGLDRATPDVIFKHQIYPCIQASVWDAALGQGLFRDADLVQDRRHVGLAEIWLGDAFSY